MYPPTDLPSDAEGGRVHPPYKTVPMRYTKLKNAISGDDSTRSNLRSKTVILAAIMRMIGRLILLLHDVAYCMLNWIPNL